MTVTLDTTNTYPITKNLRKAASVNIKSVQLGDGYKQSLLDGINYEREIYDLEFVRRSLSTAITLENLLQNSVNGPANVLSWTPPGEATPKYWEASNVSRVPDTGATWKVTATLNRVYPIL